MSSNVCRKNASSSRLTNHALLNDAKGFDAADDLLRTCIVHQVWHSNAHGTDDSGERENATWRPGQQVEGLHTLSLVQNHLNVIRERTLLTKSALRPSGFHNSNASTVRPLKPAASSVRPTAPSYVLILSDGLTLKFISYVIGAQSQRVGNIA
jgi:hypothetical protein